MSTAGGASTGAQGAVVFDLPDHLWIRLSGREAIKSKLRLSLTESCNYSCFFCHNEGQGPIRGAGGRTLTVSEIESVARVAVSQGVTTLKLTGGEPLLYRAEDGAIVDLITRLRALADLGTSLDISLTTNGSTISECASQLRRAGLNRVTMSLTTLQATTFGGLVARNRALLCQSLNGLRAIQRAGLRPLKINMALYHSERSGVGNLTELSEVLDLARSCGVAELRFFTLLWHEGFPQFRDFYQFFSPRLRDQLEQLFVLNHVDSPHDTVEILAELAGAFANYTYPKVEFGVNLGSIRIGFEAMKFGRLPNEAGLQEGPYAMRLSADGALRPTLTGEPSYDLINGIRRGLDDTELRHLYRAAQERMP